MKGGWLMAGLVATYLCGALPNWLRVRRLQRTVNYAADRADRLWRRIYQQGDVAGARADLKAFTETMHSERTDYD